MTEKTALYVKRADLRNRVWTGFLYGLGFWLGSGIGIVFVAIALAVIGVGLGGGSP